MGRTFISATCGLIAAAILVAAQPPSQSDGAANVVASCVRGTGTVFDCSQLLAVGDHILVDNKPGVCHADVTQSGSGVGGLKAATWRVSHNVSGCPWPAGTVRSFHYQATSAEPVGGKVDIGAVADAPPSAIANSDSSNYVYISVGGAVAVAAAAATALYARRRVTAR